MFKMRSQRLIAITAVLFGCLIIPSSSAQNRSVSQHVYMVICSGSPHFKGKVIQTGFRMKGTDGIVTALHGVLGAKNITASNERGEIFSDLKLSLVDVENDVALLTSAKLSERSDDGLSIADEEPGVVPNQRLRVFGHPAGIDVYEKEVKAANPTIKKLGTMIPRTAADTFAIRKSPFEAISVLNLDGNLVPGDSGAPVLNSANEVVGIVNGGILGGAAAISWAIPIHSITWRSVSVARVRLRELEALDPKSLFAVEEDRDGAPSDSGLRAGTIVANSLGMEFGYVPAGSFLMGSSDLEVRTAYDYAKTTFPHVNSFESFGWETPRHKVTISDGFYIGRYEVTQAQWKAVMTTNPSTSQGDRLPVETVSWHDAQEFIRRLNRLDDDYTYRLPSEAEWEYACRAGTTTRFALGQAISSAQANFNGNYPYGGAATHLDRQTTTPVGTFLPNAWGLYDMHGNVWEWCEDIWHENYEDAPTDGSAWTNNGDRSLRVVRGGGWNFVGVNLRSANRFSYPPDRRDNNVGGFRLVATARR